MKKTILYIITFICFSTIASAQNITQPADTVKKLLCKEWRADHMIIGNMKVRPKEIGQTIFNLEFKPDNTYIMDGGKGEKSTGKWYYDTSRKLILLMIKDGPSFKVTGLTHDELTFAFPQSEKLPADMKDARMVLKPLK